MARKILVFVLICLSLFVRLYHFPERINFGMEQGMTLAMTASYLYEKFSLLGMTNVARVTSDGHVILINPLYNYALMPFMLVLGKSPITLTYLALFVNLLTAIVLYWAVRKIWGHALALLSAFFFLFDPTMIEHSLTLWIHNLVPLLGVLSLFLLYKWQKDKTWPIVFTLGLVSGLGFAMEYMYLLTAAFLGLYLVTTAKHKFSTAILYLLGCSLAQAPMIIFDLRHDFYNLRTLWQYALDTLANPGQSKMAFYHFLQFYPLLFIALAYLTGRVFRLRWYLGIALIGLYLTYSLTSPQLSFSRAVGTPPGMNAPILMDLARQIAEDNPQDYNIVYLPQSEYRAHTLRYLLTYIHHKPPMGVEAYPSAKAIYAVGLSDLNLLSDAPWEVSAFRPKRQEILTVTANNRYTVYKLTQ